MRWFTLALRLPAQINRSTDLVRKVSHACTFLQDAYFQQTSRVQKMVLPFQIVTNDTSLCQPGIQERSAEIEGKRLCNCPALVCSWPASLFSKLEMLLLARRSACCAIQQSVQHAAHPANIQAPRCSCWQLSVPVEASGMTCKPSPHTAGCVFTRQAAWCTCWPNCVTSNKLTDLSDKLYGAGAEVQLAQMWVPGSLLRDQDVKLNMNVLFTAFERILSLNGSADAYLAAEQRDRNFAVLTAR